MKPQRAREEQAVTIGTALAIFLGAVLLVAVVIVVVVALSGRGVGDALEAATPWGLAAAGLAALAYLVRRRR